MSSMFLQTFDGSARGWFEHLSASCIDGWDELRKQFTTRCAGGHENIIIYGCPELAKRYSNKVQKMVDEMMVRLDDFIRSEEAFANTEFPKGEISEASKKLGGLVSRREDQFHRGATEQIDKGTMARTRSIMGMDSLPITPRSHTMLREEIIRGNTTPGSISMHSPSTPKKS
ncbi:hypothetical protein Tco_0146343 [Tanacetum coccineum]